MVHGAIMVGDALSSYDDDPTMGLRYWDQHTGLSFNIVLLPGYLDKLLLLERQFMSLDMSPMDILMQEDNGGLGHTMQELNVIDLQFLNSKYGN